MERGIPLSIIVYILTYGISNVTSRITYDPLLMKILFIVNAYPVSSSPPALAPGLPTQVPTLTSLYLLAVLLLYLPTQIDVS
jgi:hypothetical protein